jgi:hypothetical protein
MYPFVLAVARRGDEAPSAESAAGGVGVQLQKIKNKNYTKGLHSSVNRGMMESNREPQQAARRGDTHD